MKLLVRNLARATSETDLIALFQAHGAVQSCNLVTDVNTGLSKGFGFIEMPKPGDANAAIKMLNGTDLEGNKIRVKKAESKPPKPMPYPSAETEPAEKQPDEVQAKTTQPARPKRINPYSYQSKKVPAGEPPKRSKNEPKPGKPNRDWPKKRST